MSAIDPPVNYTFAPATSPYGRDFLNINLKMVRGNDYQFGVQVVQPSTGSFFNCSGCTLRMTAKWRPTDSDASAIFSVYSPANGIAWTSQASGQATVTVADTLTNISAVPYHRTDLVYDLQLTTQSASASARYTVMYGNLTLLPNITQTAP